MPMYEWDCPCGSRLEAYRHYSESDAPMHCACGQPARRVISRPMLVMAAPDVHYDSPIDGRPITSRKARADDLARSDCIPYDPGMKADYQRRIADGERRLDSAIEATVGAELERMPAHKREQLASEMSHATVDVVRSTYGE